MPYIPPTRHVTLLATLRRERALPVPGEVIVHAGQHVEAADVVAHAEISGAHRLLDLTRSLGVAADKADACLVKQEGEPVKKGEVIARKPGLFGPRTAVSPVDGRLVMAHEGRVLLAATTAVELRAGLPGTVVNVLPGRSVLIETTGALLDGIWGNGREDFSVLRLLGEKPEAVLDPAQLELNLRGAILAVGVLDSAAALHKLAEVGVRGLILGSAPAELIGELSARPYPVIITDRFGVHGFCQPAFNLLTGNVGRELWLDASPVNHLAGTRPEVIIPLPVGHELPPPPLEGDPLKEGKRVRVARGPQAGQVGTLLGLSDRPMPLPSGVRAHVAAVALDEGRALSRQTVTVPFANLELLE